MKSTKGITWMHVEKTKELPEEVKNLPQDKKWLNAYYKAPEWKKEEYMTQANAHQLEEIEKQRKEIEETLKLLKRSKNIALDYKKEKQDFLTWCNPLARA